MDEQVKLHNKLSLLDTLIDDRIMAYGVRNTIQYFLDLGLMPEELTDMQFTEEDVNYVVDHPDDYFDFEYWRTH